MIRIYVTAHTQRIQFRFTNLFFKDHEQAHMEVYIFNKLVQKIIELFYFWMNCYMNVSSTETSS